MSVLQTDDILTLQNVSLSFGSNAVLSDAGQSACPRVNCWRSSGQMVPERPACSA